MTKKSRSRLARVQPNRSFPFLFTWTFMGEIFRSSVLPTPCQFCKAVAIVALPESIRAAQPDATTHVCHPSAGGCNHGFTLDETPRVPRWYLENRSGDLYAGPGEWVSDPRNALSWETESEANKVRDEHTPLMSRAIEL